MNSEDAEREFEDRIAHRYNRDYHEPPIMKRHSEAFVRYLARIIQPGDRVLDLGCASASLWGLFDEQLDASISLVGVDLSPKMLQEARLQFPMGDFRIGSMTNIPAGDGEFDVVIVSSAFHHISDQNLPDALLEVHRVLDEHGVLIGREPLCVGRLGDRGGWIAGALMNLRHLAFRLTHTREYPEPDPGPDHHAYDAKEFINLLSTKFSIENIEFRNPASLFLARIHHPVVVEISNLLDELVDHKEGQEIHYVARKNFATAADVAKCVRLALEQNVICEMPRFLAYVEEAARVIERILDEKNNMLESPNVEQGIVKSNYSDR